MIGFVIPTWNRADHLRKCVESIAAQNPECIVISDNASTDHTMQVCDELCSKYPFIVVMRYPDHVDGCESIKRAVNLGSSDYTWMFGDDDVLVPGALRFVQEAIKGTGCDFYHVAETKRAADPMALNGTVIDLCNSIGFTDFTGFISCNIAKTDKLQAGFNSPNWSTYTKSSFPQSLAILDSMANSPAMMLQFGCVESADETQETRDRWNSDDICWRYLYVGEGLKLLVDQGKIPAKLPEVFFRYLDGVLFGRLMHDFNYRIISPKAEASDSDWDCFLYMANMVDGERGKLLFDWVSDVRKIAIEHKEILKAASFAYEKLTKATDSISLPVFPISYLPS